MNAADPITASRKRIKRGFVEARSNALQFESLDPFLEEALLQHEAVVRDNLSKTKSKLTPVAFQRLVSSIRFTKTCWIWKARQTSKGYAEFYIKSKPIRAHKLIYEMIVSPVPVGLQLDHLCRVRHCVNPLHLEPVTPKVNVLRGNGVTAQNARKTHCIKGHPLTKENITTTRGSRDCRLCNNIRACELRKRRKDAAHLIRTTQPTI